jgi:hypothetical protein
MGLLGRMDPKEVRSQLSTVYGQEKAGAGMLLGLDIIDWSCLLIAIAMIAVIIVLGVGS